MDDDQENSNFNNLFSEETAPIFKTCSAKPRLRAELREKLRKKLKKRREKLKAEKRDTDGLIPPLPKIWDVQPMSAPLLKTTTITGHPKTAELAEHPQRNHLASIIDKLWKITPVAYITKYARVLSSQHAPCYLQRNIQRKKNMVKQRAHKKRRMCPSVIYKPGNRNKRNDQKNLADFYFRSKNHHLASNRSKRVSFSNCETSNESSNVSVEQCSMKYETVNMNHLNSSSSDSSSFEHDGLADSCTSDSEGFTGFNPRLKPANRITPLFGNERELSWRSVLIERK